MMPRFSETEKENIRRRLLTEGERLFAAHGLKKVTIDDIVGAVSIAKATFYTFHDSKEALYLDIVQGVQKEIFTQLEALLERNADLPGADRVRQAFGLMARLMSQRPILAQVSPSTVDLIARKVSPERTAAYARQNTDAAKSLRDHGVRFTCDTETASYAFQALYHSWLFMRERDAEQTEAVIRIMLDGILSQIL